MCAVLDSNLRTKKRKEGREKGRGGGTEKKNNGQREERIEREGMKGGRNEDREGKSLIFLLIFLFLSFPPRLSELKVQKSNPSHFLTSLYISEHLTCSVCAA